MDEKTSANTGVQSASRVLALLKLVGAHEPEGVRLKDLIAESGQDRSTAHRLLACLVDSGFVERTPAGKRYRLGLEAMQLGLAGDSLNLLVDRFRPLMRALAQDSGDTVFLIVRAADHALCLHREEGPYPIKAFIVTVGSRRLLGLSSVGLGIVSRWADAEIAALHERHAAEYARSGLSAERLMALVAATRAAGYAQTSDFRRDETSGVGCAVRLSASTWAGLSIAAINSRMPAERRHTLGLRLAQALQDFEWRPPPAAPQRGGMRDASGLGL
jgi:DNA-binding IclR family transcriptional regulator